MTTIAQKRILTVLMQYEYGKPEWGPSCEMRWFHDSLVGLCQSVDVFHWDRWVQDQTGLRESLVGKIKESRPDLVLFVPYQDQFSPALLDEIRAHAPTLAWFGDDHWRFADFSSRYARHFTHTVTTDPWSVQDYRAIGIEPIVSDWASDRIDREMQPIADDSAYRYDVTFVGGANESRRWYISRLARAGITVECFGQGWSGRVSHDQMQTIFRESRISLNLSNSAQDDIGFVLGSPRNLLRWIRSKKRREQVKARNFEIPMVGGFQLSHYALGLERHFRIGDEIAVFGNPDDCIRQIRYHLANPAERIAMASRAYRRARDQHTYTARFRAIFSQVWP